MGQLEYAGCWNMLDGRWKHHRKSPEQSWTIYFDLSIMIRHTVGYERRSAISLYIFNAHIQFSRAPDLNRNYGLLGSDRPLAAGRETRLYSLLGWNALLGTASPCLITLITQHYHRCVAINRHSSGQHAAESTTAADRNGVYFVPGRRQLSR
jgi:hypothetical protein